VSNLEKFRKSAYVKGLYWAKSELCWICGYSIDTTLDSYVFYPDGSRVQNVLSFSEDHVIPKSLGGSDTIENIKPAHLLCNEVRQAQEVTEILIKRLRSLVMEELESPRSLLPAVDIFCEMCGTSFRVTFTRSERWNAKYCSLDCLYDSMRTTFLRECLQCSELFSTNPSRVRDGRGKYCSRKCYSLSFGGVELTCSRCDREYCVSESNKRAKVRLYCSTCRKL